MAHCLALLQQTPPAQRAALAHVAKGAFADGLNLILLVGAIIAFAAAVIAFCTIRQRDFVNQGGGAAGGH